MSRCFMWKKEDAKPQGVVRNSLWLRIFFFPHEAPRHRKLDFRSRLSQGWLGAATQKSEHSTRLSGCKQEWRVANVGCFVKAYTTNCGISAPNPTTGCDVSPASLLPRNSHIATAIPANSRVNSLTDLRFCHQCCGSKSPSRALAMRTSMPCGKTLWKIYRARLVW